jgi:hypothetical protein
MIHGAPSDMMKATGAIRKPSPGFTAGRVNANPLFQPGYAFTSTGMATSQADTHELSRLVM